MNWIDFKEKCSKLEHKDPPLGLISPSSLPDLTFCPGSKTASEGFHNPHEEAALRGTCLHELARMALTADPEVWPASIPEEEREQAQVAVNQIVYWESEGWKIVQLRKVFA